MGARKITYHLGASYIDNTTIACQVLANMLVWLSYISVSSWIAPDCLCLLLCRVKVEARMSEGDVEEGSSLDPEATGESTRRASSLWDPRKFT